jgi:hypothetical protein
MDITKALVNLRPGAQWSLSGDDYEGITWLEPNEEDGGQTQPSKEEVLEEIERLKEEYVNNQYQRNRAKAYPSITDQLDMLYHGGLDAWKEEINKIKQQYPKPVEG